MLLGEDWWTIGWPIGQGGRPRLEGPGRQVGGLP
jgi:hypothetical protein